MVMVRSDPERIGILGGTFDPVHLGHLAVARVARQSLALDRVLFVPSYKPPHKVDLTIVPFAQRLAMLELALADEPRFVCSALEGERQELSYTFDTLKEMRRRLDPATKFFFLLGFDAFVEMASWKRYREIPGLADLVVINRPSERQGSMDAVVEQVFGVHAMVSRSAPCLWRLAAGGHIHALVMDDVPVSSSAIRQALAGGDDVAAMLPPAVAAYIHEHRLYCVNSNGGG